MTAGKNLLAVGQSPTFIVRRFAGVVACSHLDGDRSSARDEAGHVSSLERLRGQPADPEQVGYAADRSAGEPGVGDPSFPSPPGRGGPPQAAG